jgi:hypothetical protein
MSAFRSSARLLHRTYATQPQTSAGLSREYHEFLLPLISRLLTFSSDRPGCFGSARCCWRLLRLQRS